MTYENKSILYDKDGNPIPQHFDREIDDFSDTQGSDGATHTKIVDVNGEPIDPRNVEVGNLPTNYPDSAVKAELQAIKADNAIIKQQNADILTELRGTLKTQLTGSNVDLTWINQYEIRDTTQHTLPKDIIPFENFENAELIISSTLNAICRLDIIKIAGLGIDGQPIKVDGVPLTVSFHDETTIYRPEVRLTNDIQVILTCDNTPTSGNVTIAIIERNGI